MEIMNHPFQDRIMSGALTVDQFIYLCSKPGGAAINIRCDSNGTALQLKCYDIFYGQSSLQLWSVVHHNSNFKRQLNSMTDHKRRSSMYSVYLDEIIGDGHQTQCLVREYEMIISKHAINVNIDEQKAAPMCTRRIKKEFTLISDDDKVKFVEFEAHVSMVCENAIRSWFGAFVVLTAPILSQLVLATMASKLKSGLPSVYTIISSLLNYEGRRHLKRKQHLASQYDRFILYTFFSMMRICRPSNFSWWAACNTSAFYGTFGNQGNISVYFGQSLLHSSLIRKLESFASYSLILQKTTTHLYSPELLGL
jgi:hypothetical protein